MSQLPRFRNRIQGQHARRPSVISGTSDIAESTLTMGTMITGESLRLSQFPQPPSSAVLNPAQTEQSSLSGGRRDEVGSGNSTSPIVSPRQRALPDPLQSIHELSGPIDASSGISSNSRTAWLEDASSIAPSLSSRTLSPYDWHEGASSIDVDGTDDRMLPTAFITQLLRENPGPTSSRRHRISTNSDGLSGFSELTYPPPPRRVSIHFPRSAPHPPSRPAGGRPPPSRQIAGNTSDTETLINPGDERLRSAIHANGVIQQMGVQENIVDVPPTSLRNARYDGSLRVPNHDHSRSEPKGYDNGSTLDWDDDATYEKGYTGHSRDASDFLSNDVAQPTTLHQTREYRKSMSSKSFVSSLLSRGPSSSSRSIRRAMDWMRVKPLPPVPVLPQNLAPKRLSPNQPQQQNIDDGLGLPDLITRAGTLSDFLEKGYYPHRSTSSNLYSHLKSHPNSQPFPSAFDDPTRENSVRNTRLGFGTAKGNLDQHLATQNNQACFCCPRSKQARIVLLASVILLVVIATTVGVTMSRIRHRSSSNCSGNFTGSACNLDATCICTSTSGCNPLAKNLVELRPAMNELFRSNYSVSSLATSLWLVQGNPTGSNCASQSRLIDTGAVLRATQVNRTKWAQSALLWTLVQSQDLKATEDLRKFVLNAPWADLGEGDGPVNSASALFTTAASGFSFDFAAQAFGPASNATFSQNGQPLPAQADRVSVTAHAVLDRMYWRAVAASTQKTKTLENYWRSVLQQKLTDLPVFLSSLRTIPILLPFNAAASGPQSVISLLPGPSFPPPLACYPGLTDTQLRGINSLENKIFQLPMASSPSQFSTSCFPDRPTYGILDVLGLRLPFLDARSGLAKQAIVLKPEVAARVVIYSGEALSAIPAGPGADVSADVYQYGTLGNFNHIVYNYLSSISDINLAISLVQFVLSRSSAPPTDSILLSSLPSIPPLEVAVFGAIDVTDISSVASSFSTPSGSLFFGSDAAKSLRTWAIKNVDSSVVWTEFATSRLVVRDTSFDDTIFNQTWDAAAANIRSASVDLVIQSFGSTGKLVP